MSVEIIIFELYIELVSHGFHAHVLYSFKNLLLHYILLVVLYVMYIKANKVFCVLHAIVSVTFVICHIPPMWVTF